MFAVAFVALIDRFALAVLSARTHAVRDAEDRVFAEFSGEARRTHANSIDTTALDNIDTLAAVHANHVLLLALGSTQRVFGVAFALALDAIAAALGAVHVAALVLLLLAVLAFVVGSALAFVAAFAVTVR